MHSIFGLTASGGPFTKGLLNKGDQGKGFCCQRARHKRMPKQSTLVPAIETWKVMMETSSLEPPPSWAICSEPFHVNQKVMDFFKDIYWEYPPKHGGRFGPNNLTDSFDLRLGE